MNAGDPLSLTQADLAVRKLGTRTFPSPLDGGLLERGESLHYVGENDRVLVDGTLAAAGNATARRRAAHATLAALTLIALALFDANQNFPFGGPSLLIMVGVGLDTVKQIDAQLQQHHYEGLLRT